MIMTRARQRKLKRIETKTRGHMAWRALPLTSALLACMHPAHAADTAETPVLEEITVTAQKRAENLQDVALSIQAFGTARLEELHIDNFDDYAQFLPSVSFQKVGSPSFEHTYMRGVSSGGDGNHSGSQPSVGMYLDEQPITTIDGNLNIHIYDIERVEALAGPQGTLYGASSQAGTIRIISNKPDPSGFKAGYDIDLNKVAHGGSGKGYDFEAFVNLPLSDIAAVRLVGWDQHDAGYINNVHGQVTFPTSGIAFDNGALVKNDYNTVETKGGRAALKIQLNDNWSILPTIMGQVQQTDGDFAYQPSLGDLEVQHFFPDFVHDSWVQSALTVEGKIADFDLVYAGAYLTRNTHEQSDYTDYSLFYDTAYGKYFVDSAGKLINPAQTILGTDHYTKYSHELRVSSPKENRWRFVGGLFLERQVHEILQDYLVDNGDPLGSVPPNNVSIPGWPGTLWLTDQERVDRDRAIFGEFTFDFTDHLSGSAGLRHFTYNNSLQGFYGFNDTYSSHEGIATCFTPFVPFHGAPCSDLDRGTSGSGNSPKLNLTYKFDHDRMIYATYSKGFRPGGVNRNGGGTIAPYQPDYLKNYEIGWKTTWFDNRLRFNGAIFREDWSNFQFSYLGQNSLTIITNAGQARINGLESDLEFAVTQNFTMTGGFSWLDAKLTQTFCGDPTICSAPGFDPSTYEQYAPSGTRLPVTPKFKGNVTGRYTFPVGSYKGNVQASAVYVGERTTDLRPLAANALGDEPGYTVLDISAGVEMNNTHFQIYVNNAADRRAVLDRYAECDVLLCGAINKYDVPNQPRTVGVKFGQKF
jgi:iron complex outermembrane receptor protein